MTSRGIQLPLATGGEAVFDCMADGSLIVRNARDLGPYPNHVTERLQVWAAAARRRLFPNRRWTGLAGARRSSARSSLRWPDCRRLQACDRHVGPRRFVEGSPVEAPAPEMRDVVIAWENRDCVAVLGIPSTPDIAGDETARAQLRAKLMKLATEASGDAQRVLRFVFLTKKLSIDTGELTDKGAISQRTILRRHVASVEKLYADSPADDVVCRSLSDPDGGGRSR